MKRLILLITVSLIFVSAKVETHGHYIQSILTEVFNSKKETAKPTFAELHQPLIDALIQVESNGKEDAIGDRGKAIGVLQIHPIMVREVNNCLKELGLKKTFSYKDRFSRKKSIEMFLIWAEYHHKDHDFERMARCWNGGPNGYRYKTTNHYWNKVQIELNKNQYIAQK